MTERSRKKSLYLPEWVLDEAAEEGKSMSHSVSQMFLDAWRIARITPVTGHPPGVTAFTKGTKSPYTDPVTQAERSSDDVDGSTEED